MTTARRDVVPAWLLSAALTAGLAACGAPPPPALPMLTADPPEESQVAEGAVRMEISIGAEFLKHGKLAEAKAHLERANQIEPTPAAWSYLGAIAERAGDRAGAEAAYEKALALDPAHTDAVEKVAVSLLAPPPRADRAAEILARAITKAPTARLHALLGRALGQKGDVAGAGKAYEAALALGEDAELRLAWGTLLAAHRQPEPAAAQLDKALDHTLQKGDPAALLALGRVMAEAKAYKPCLRAVDKAVSAKPGDAAALALRATCKLELGDARGALGDAQAALRGDPKSAEAHYALGLAHAALRAGLKAMDAFETAARLGGDGPVGAAARAKAAEVRKKLFK